MADRVASSPESFIELRHMAMCFTKIWLPVKGFLIGSECALPLPLIFQHDPEVEMGECRIRAVLYGPTTRRGPPLCGRQAAADMMRLA
jgi:hypothetical protein